MIEEVVEIKPKGEAAFDVELLFDSEMGPDGGLFRCSFPRTRC